ncbi:MAG TPA: hypothetical protein VF022_03225, partial [Rhodanobacteraceae bacterium]
GALRQKRGILQREGIQPKSGTGKKEDARLSFVIPAKAGTQWPIPEQSRRVPGRRSPRPEWR